MPNVEKRVWYIPSALTLKIWHCFKSTNSKCLKFGFHEIILWLNCHPQNNNLWLIDFSNPVYFPCHARLTNYFETKLIQPISAQWDVTFPAFNSLMCTNWPTWRLRIIETQKQKHFFSLVNIAAGKLTTSEVVMETPRAYYLPAFLEAYEPLLSCTQSRAEQTPSSRSLSATPPAQCAHIAYVELLARIWASQKTHAIIQLNTVNCNCTTSHALCAYCFYMSNNLSKPLFEVYTQAYLDNTSGYKLGNSIPTKHNPTHILKRQSAVETIALSFLLVSVKS